MTDSIKYFLPESEMSKSWYNIAADLPPPPPLTTSHFSRIAIIATQSLQLAIEALLPPAARPS